MSFRSSDLLSMNMSPNQKEILISKLKTEKKEYEHYKDDLKDFKFQILTLQEKIMKLNKEKELEILEYNKINESNYKEIASYKTEITLSLNETLILEDEIKETKEKTNVLVQMNQNQDVFLEDMRENFQEIQNERMQIKEENNNIDHDIEEFEEIRNDLFEELNNFNSKLEEINHNKKYYEEKLKEAKLKNCSLKKKLTKSRNEQENLNQKIKEVLEEIKKSELRLNQKENEVFNLEILHKAKMVERTHIDLELKNIKERVNKYKSDNETLTEEIKKAFETTEENTENLAEIKEQINSEEQKNNELIAVKNELNNEIDTMVELSKELERLNVDLQKEIEALINYDEGALLQLDRGKKCLELLSFSDSEISKSYEF